MSSTLPVDLQITIEPVTEAGIPLVRFLAREIWQAHYPGIITQEQIDYMLASMYSPEVIEGEMGAGVVYEIIALGTEAVGFLSYAYEPLRGRVKLSKFYVHPRRHGRGIGWRAFLHVKDCARRLGALEIYLFVNKRNDKAIRAYKQFGLSVKDSVVTDIGGGFVMDDYMMTYLL